MSRRIAIVQARMGSRRFPGKMMASLEGRLLVDYVLARLVQCCGDDRPLDAVVLATSAEPADAPLANHVARHWPGVIVVRGSENDVLGRFLDVLTFVSAETVVRVTGDCPLVNTAHLQRLIAQHEAAGADVTNYRPGFEYVDKGVEVVGADALRRVAADPELTPRDREHVTALLYRRPERYRVHYVDSEPFLRRGDLRLTVDTPEDLDFFENLARQLGQDLVDASLDTVVAFLDRHPKLAERNAHAGRKSTMHEAFRVGFRCDGGPEIGLGHIVGSLRLATRLARERGAGIEFVVRDEAAVVRLIKRAGFSVEVLPPDVTPAEDVARIVGKAEESDWAAVAVNFCKDDLDRYAPLFPQLKAAGVPLVFMDNPVPPSYRLGDLVVNALPHPAYEGYAPDAHPACYDGLEYLLLDDRYLSYRGEKRVVQERVGRILVAMGGGDHPNTTALVLDGLALAHFDGFVDVVLGAANPHEASVRAIFQRFGLRGSVERNVADLPERMLQADIGFSALGLTTYEMAFMGLPVLIVTTTPFNAGVADCYTAQHPGALHLGLWTEVNPARIAKAVLDLSPAAARVPLALAQQGSVDGYGAQRVLNVFDEVLSLRCTR